MKLTGIIAISGRPGLFKVIAQGKNNVIVESLIDNKRFPAYSSDRISALEDISIYTYEEEKPLKEIFLAIHTKENGGEAISHKDSENNLVNYISEILPNYDKERVYISDIKKLFQWYNLLHKSGNLNLAEVIAENNEAANDEPKKEEKKEKAPAKPKAAAKPKTTTEKGSAAKSSGAKKVTATKTSTSRGK
ncbi:MAG: DUF5606 domain-containing protein [Flavobacteriia bacterium]|nr:DUF5606 domain-containing protein [Flavobacteriia bacterium]